VVFSGTSSVDSVGTSSGTLTIGAGITVQGQTGYVGSSPETGGSFSSIAVVNQGTIQASASGGTINVEAASIQNTGALDAANGGTLSAYSLSFTTTGTIEADAGSTISIGGTIDNTGSVFAPAGAGTVDITGTVDGGTISVGTGTTLNLADSTLDGVTLSGNYQLAGNSFIYIQGNLTLDGTLTLGSGNSYGVLYFESGTNQTLGGSGTVVFSGTNSDDSVGSSSGTLTIASGITVRGQNGYVGYSPAIGGSPSNVAVVNQGTIQADVSDGTITVDGTNDQNAGDLNVLNGATLSVQGTLTNLATVSVDATSVLSLSGTLTGGTIDTQTGAQIYGAALEGVTVNGNFTVADDNSLTVEAGLTLNGTLLLGDQSSDVYGYVNFSGTQTLGGTGTVVFGQFEPNMLFVSQAGTTLTIGPGITVRGQSGSLGYSGVLFVSPTNVSVVNEGTIQADVSGGQITVYQSGGAFQNAGTVNASDGAIYVFDPSYGMVNSGTVGAGPTGTLEISGPYSQSSTGNFDEVLGGSTPGVYGQTSIHGTAALNGSLNIDLVNGYTPAQGASFAILTFTSETGNFSAENGLYLGGGESFSPTFSPLSNPTALDLVVIAANAGSLTTVQSSQNPSDYGDTVTFTALVTPAVSTNLTPTGTVTFFDGASDLGSATLVNGSAAFTTSTLVGGSHSIVAQYNGDSNFGVSSSAPISQTVDPIASQTALQSSNNPSYFGAPVTFTANVSSSSTGLITPTGEVEFFDGSTLLGTENLSGGTASFTTSSLSVGANQPIEAEYLGDSNYSPSNLTIQQTVQPPPPTDTWISTASGSWTVGSNWSTGAVPTSNEAVIIDVPGATPTITISSGNQSVLYITASDPLSITGGSLSVAAYSTIGDGLSMTGGSLVASGAGTVLAVTGTTAVSGASLYAEGGATLSLSQLTTYTNSTASTMLEATGTGSVLSLPDLTSITDTSEFVETDVEALAGGDVELPLVTQISGSVLVETNSAASTLDVSHLTNFTGGTLVYSGGTLNSSGSTQQMPALSSANDWNLQVSGGVSLSLPVTPTRTPPRRSRRRARGAYC
jgi:hypothetical protein